MAKAKSKGKATSLGAHCHPVEMSAADKKRQEEWEAEDDARALQRAMEIQKDPARMKRVRAWAKKKITAIEAATK